MKTLLTSNTKKEILLDDHIYDCIKHLTVSDTGNNLIVHARDKGKLFTFALAKIIIITDKPIVDHKDGNYLNCQLNNLRPASYRQNNINRKHDDKNTSGYRGVFKSDKRWRARIRTKKGRIHLGIFKTKEEAAIAYDIAATKYHEEFAILNFK